MASPDHVDYERASIAERGIAVPALRRDSDTLAVAHAMAGSYQTPGFMALGPLHSTVSPSAMQNECFHDQTSECNDDSGFAEQHSIDCSCGQATSVLATTLNSANNPDPKQPTETTQLLGPSDTTINAGTVAEQDLNQHFKEQDTLRDASTTWKKEAKLLGKYSWSLILTFALQYSLPLASVFTIGHLGTIELGAVSLGSMTANITGYSVVGLLCAVSLLALGLTYS